MQQHDIALSWYLLSLMTLNQLDDLLLQGFDTPPVPFKPFIKCAPTCKAKHLKNALNLLGDSQNRLFFSVFRLTHRHPLLYSIYFLHARFRCRSGDLIWLLHTSLLVTNTAAHLMNGLTGGVSKPCNRRSSSLLHLLFWKSHLCLVCRAMPQGN